MVLTKTEQKMLLQIGGTKQMAEKLISRNKPMLKLTKAWLDFKRNKGKEPKTDEYEGTVGCPHCIEASVEDHFCDCENCRWSLIAKDCCSSSYYCLEMTFGGVNYQEQSCVEYEKYCEMIESLEEADDDELEDLSKFLQGHVEWGKLLLKQKSPAKSLKRALKGRKKDE